MLLMAFSLPLLGSCTASKRADKTVTICLASPENLDLAINKLNAVSERFGFVFKDYGNGAKSDAENIGADRSIIPVGRPVQADVERSDGKVLLMASNFGSAAGALRLSFFYNRDQGEGSPFFRSVISEMDSLPDAKWQSDLAGEDARTCPS